MVIAEGTAPPLAAGTPQKQDFPGVFLFDDGVTDEVVLFHTDFFGDISAKKKRSCIDAEP